MTEVNTANAIVKPLLDKESLKALRTALGGDRVAFESTVTKTTDANGNEVETTLSAFEQVEKLIGEVAAKTTKDESGPFFGLPLLTRLGDEKIDPIQKAERIVVATVGQRDKASNTNGIKAIVIFAQPTADEFLSDESEAAAGFVTKLIEREASDVAFSGLRGADMTLADLQSAVESIPATVDAIVTVQRASSGLDTEAFDAVWQSFRMGVLKAKQPVLEAALGKKPEIIKALRSKSYALANPVYTDIEKAGAWVKIGRALVAAGGAMLDKEGKPDPVDMSTVESWLDNRDSVHIAYEVPSISAAQLAEINF